MAVNITLYFAFQMEHLDAYLDVELLEVKIPLLDLAGSAADGYATGPSVL